MAIREKKNPIIIPEMIKPSKKEFKVVSVINAGVTTYNNKIILLLRVAEQVDLNRIDLNKINLNKIDNKKPNFNVNNLIVVPFYNINKNKFEILTFDKNDKALTLLDTRGIKYKEKTYLSSISHLRLAISEDGVNFNISKEPTIVPESIYEEYGIEDPRITKFDYSLNNKNSSDFTYYITYTSVSRYGITVSLIETFDFKNFKRKGVILPPDNKDVILFPQKINNYFYLLHRPMKSAFIQPSMWISKTNDLRFWGNHQFLIGPRKNYWDSQRIGGGDVPILIDEGWLTIYHGVDKSGKYHLGALLLDKNNPTKVLKRSKVPILSPEKEYETKGFYGNVVFSCGSIKKGNAIHIYYGAADQSLCLAKITIDEIFKSF